MTTTEATAPAPDATRKPQWAYSVTILLSAFLLFEIQLILAKFFLPWFGGTPALWTTCMFFFQSLLVVGYLYAHFVAHKVPLRRQGLVHLVVLAAALAVSAGLCLRWRSPLFPSSSWKPGGVDQPVAFLVILLSLSAGASFFTLSATGPLLQSWFGQTHAGNSPYRLYSLSSLGSFLALLSYPLLVEPWLSLRVQGSVWLLLYCAFVLSCGYCALKLRGVRHADEDATSVADTQERTPRASTCLLWFTLSACGSLLFLGTTSQICQNVAVVPLLWVLPLSVYLLTLVICFEKERYYFRGVFHPAVIVALLLVVFLLSEGTLTRISTQIGAYSVVLFVGCMVCHGELVRSKPAVRYLTLFYLLVSLGGAAAGVFVVLLAPNLFTGFWEYQIGLWLTALLLLVSVIRDRNSWVYCTRFGPLLIAATTVCLPVPIIFMLHGKIGFDYGFLLLLITVAVLLVRRQTQVGYSKPKAQAAMLFGTFSMLLLAVLFVLSSRLQTSALLRVRNFYGVLNVKPINGNQPKWAAYGLTHGLISHGFQFRSPTKRQLATGYYGAESGVGRAIRVLRRENVDQHSPMPLHLGVIGLGVGTLAAYGQRNDQLRFYEINPGVIKIAEDPQYFTYLSECKASKQIIVGDARLSMERELSSGNPPQFDLLVIDAFSGDAPPVHLLTIEAFRLYMKELMPRGILAVHITNAYVDLRPVVLSAAAQLGLNAVFIHDDGDGSMTLYSDWMLLSRRDLPPGTDSSDTAKIGSPVVLWTDDYSNLLRILR